MITYNKSSISQKKSLRSLLLCILTTCLLLACDSNQKSQTPALKSSAKGDSTTHSVYSTYKFGNNENTIDFGTQPLAVPTGTLPEILNRDQILAKSLSDAGQVLQLHSFYKGKDINFFMKRGDLELAVAGDMPTLSAAAQNYAVALALVKQNYSAIITRDLDQVSELKGKRVGNAAGSSAHYALMEALQTEGLTSDDIILVPMKVNEMTEALQQGKIDAFSAWEPTPTIALKTSDKFKVLHRSLSSSYLYCARPFLEKHPETVRHIVASIARSMKWVALSRNNILQASDWTIAAANSFSGKKSALNKEEYAKLIEDGIVNIASSPIIPLSVLRENGQIFNEFRFMKKMGKLEDKVSWPQTLNNFNRKIIAEIFNNPSEYMISQYNFQK